MTSAPIPEKYKVDCIHCRGKYDALTARWCNCLVKERTLKCPHCDQCFCTAPATFKRAFWSNAPEAMWARKRSEQKLEVGYTNPPVAEVTRPLVLVVDDEREIQQVAIRVISQLGYGVVVAKNGEEGLQLAHEYKPELVLTDAMMPKLDGREMGLRIKESSDLVATKVAIMTSLYTDPRYKYEALKEFKADAYVAKPLDAAQLREMLRKLLG